MYVCLTLKITKNRILKKVYGRAYLLDTVSLHIRQNFPVGINVLNIIDTALSCILLRGDFVCTNFTAQKTLTKVQRRMICATNFDQPNRKSPMQ